MEGEVAASALVYKNARKRIATWTEERVHSLREAAELADRHYRLGAVPVSTYIELQENYLEAVESINDVKADALEAALDLEQLTGANQRLAKTATKKSK